MRSGKLAAVISKAFRLSLYSVAFVISADGAVAEARSFIPKNVLCETATIRQEAEKADEADDIWLKYVDQEKWSQRIDQEAGAAGATSIVACLTNHEILGLEAHAVGETSLFLADANLGEARLAGFAQAASNAQSSVTTGQTSSIAPVSNKQMPSYVDHSLAETLLRLELLTIALSVLLFALASFGLHNLRRMVVGVINRRHICDIPANLSCKDAVFEGRISVLGLDTARFTPKYQGDLDEIQGHLGTSKRVFFSLVVGEIPMNVFVQKTRPGCISTFFDTNLTPTQHRALLARSTMTPKLGQFASTKPNKKLREQLIMERYVLQA